MQLTVLGCQAGVPRHGRASSGYLVADADVSVLLDCGPGVAAALSGLHVRPDAVVVTHLHLDHCHDLLPLAKQLITERLAAGVSTAGPPVPLLVPRGAAEVLDTWSGLFPVPTMPLLDRAFDHAFAVREYTPGDTLRVGELDVTLHEVAHAVPACGVRVDGPRASLAYTGDTGVCAGLEHLARDVDLLLAEATLAAPDTGTHGHLCAADAARAATAAGAGQLVLTHLPDGDDATAAMRLAAASELFPGPVHVAVPGATHHSTIGTR